jgi:hypothetical protein
MSPRKRCPVSVSRLRCQNLRRPCEFGGINKTVPPTDRSACEVFESGELFFVDFTPSHS